MPQAKPKTLNEALLEAQKSLSGVAKDGTNTHHRYDYVSAEAMIGVCRKALHEHGIVLSAGSVELVPFAATEHGDAVIVNHGMRLSFAPSDEMVELVRGWPAVPGKGRPLDKAVAGAQTACLSYLLRDLLLIPRGDEEGIGMDDSSRSQLEATPAPRATQNADRPRPEQKAPAPRTTNQRTGQPNFVKGDIAVETGENPEHVAGREGEVFWVKGERIGVRWGSGKEDVAWGSMRDFDEPEAKQGTAQPDNAPQDYDSIPF